MGISFGLRLVLNSVAYEVISHSEDLVRFTDRGALHVGQRPRKCGNIRAGASIRKSTAAPHHHISGDS